MTDRVEELAKVLFVSDEKRGWSNHTWDLVDEVWRDDYRALANDAMQWFLSTPGLKFDDEAYDEGYRNGYDEGYDAGFDYGFEQGKDSL